MRPDDPADRRRNRTLRELLDELIELARHLANDDAALSPSELAYAHERLEWLADEIWVHATGHGGPAA